MKKIRLEIPLGTKKYLSNNIWLKVVGNGTKAFYDKQLSKPIPVGKKIMSVSVEVPEELDTIEVMQPCPIIPLDDIYKGWKLCALDPTWKISNLKKIEIIFQDMVHEVPIVNEKPNILEIEAYKGSHVYNKYWALVVYIFNDKTTGVFHWHSSMAVN